MKDIIAKAEEKADALAHAMHNGKPGKAGTANALLTASDHYAYVVEDGVLSSSTQAGCRR